MAKQTIVRLRDDIDGTEASQTVQFTWAGTAYEIDLNKKNAEQFAQAVSPYLRAARRANAGARRRGTARKAVSASRPDVSAIRQWAAQNGYQVAERGRMPNTVIEAFNARQESRSGATSANSAATKPAARKAAKKAARKRPAARKAPAQKAAKRTSAARRSAPRKAAARKASTGRNS